MKLTKEQFITQFPYKTDISKVKYMMSKDSNYEGVEVYRILNILVIKQGEDYYSHK